ncbi:phosphatase PAP2 family protein [Noviherbaspirillum saxi]|nr:phosphatase PAP2 family protein [Noviherbaspirillum saxi]
MKTLINKLLEYTLRLLRGRWADLAILFAGVLFPLFLFGELAEDVLEKEAFSFDQPLLLLMNSHSTPLLDALMVFFSEAGSIRILGPCALAIAVFQFVHKLWARLVYWVLGFGGAVLINITAKLIFTRTRPDLWISIAPETSYSFPSGHAMQSMAFIAALTVLAWHERRRSLLLLAGGIFVVLVGTSRVYLGVHYPSDILAGWTASLAWCCGLAIILGNRLRQPRV